MVEALNSHVDIGALLDKLRADDQGRATLRRLLSRSHNLYDGRGANQVSRIRGYILASLEEGGPHKEDLKFILEELESSQDPYMVAAAARALRGADFFNEEFLDYLLRAVANIQYRDDCITFECFEPEWPVEHPTSALTEIFSTLGSFGKNAAPVKAHLRGFLEQAHFSSSIKQQILSIIADIEREPDAEICCCSPPDLGGYMEVSCGLNGDLEGVEVQDQDGATLSLSRYLSEQPTIITFFYTRCDNPNKCSLTITKLAQLQRKLESCGQLGSVRTAAISYDPEYDSPAGLRAYCENRGFLFEGGHRAFRTVSNYQKIVEFFSLGVSYSGSVVSQHRIELFVLDSAGKIKSTFAHLQWDVDAVASEAAKLIR